MKRDEGFALAEVLVAFIILAMILGAATVSVSVSAKLYRRADEIRAAQELAERILAVELATTEVKPGVENGSETSGFSWQLRRTIVVDGYGPGGDLTRVALDVFNRRGQLAGHYQTYRIIGR